MKHFIRTAILVCWVAVPIAAVAQAYPAKPLRMVLALGGGGETLARFIGQKMSDSMGQPESGYQLA